MWAVFASGSALTVGAWGLSSNRGRRSWLGVYVGPPINSKELHTNRCALHKCCLNGVGSRNQKLDHLKPHPWLLNSSENNGNLAGFLALFHLFPEFRETGNQVPPLELGVVGLMPSAGNWWPGGKCVMHTGITGGQSRIKLLKIYLFANITSRIDEQYTNGGHLQFMLISFKRCTCLSDFLQGFWKHNMPLATRQPSQEVLPSADCPHESRHPSARNSPHDHEVIKYTKKRWEKGLLATWSLSTGDIMDITMFMRMHDSASKTATCLCQGAAMPVRAGTLPKGRSEESRRP